MVTVNDDSDRYGECWICGDTGDHGGVPHSEAMGDGVTRYQIVDLMHQGGYTWR